MDDAFLESALRTLGRQLEYPAPVDVASTVVARLRAEPRARIASRRRSLRWQPVAAAVFVLVLIGALTLTAVPGFRHAVADLLGFDKLRIEVNEEPIPDVGRGLALGERVTLQAAQRSFGAPVPIADASLFGAPEGIYLSRGEVPMLSVVYGPGPGLPAAGRGGVSVLVSTLDGELFDGFGEKVVSTSQASVQVTSVRGRQGYWIEGEHAFFIYSTAEGFDHVETARIADSVLIWQEGSLIYRVEGEMTRRAAVEFAASLDLDG
jgi:hypothetical protein